MSRPSARDLIELVFDDASWVSWDTPPVRPGGLDEGYAAELAAAAEKSGVDESVITGEALLRGRRVAVMLGEFRFLAGSIGRAAADRLVAAIERATIERLPLVSGPVSGGTRMQEGTPAFVQMVRISQAVAAHKAAGLPYLVYLRHPTTGGVMASWGSLGQVTAAEPEALVGFLGPRVYSALYGREFPEGVQTSENLAARGIIDAVVGTDDIGEVLHRALNVLSANRYVSPGSPAPLDEPIPTWTRGTRSPGPAARTAPAYAVSSGMPPPTSCLSAAPARASRTPGCWSRWRGSARRRACSWARTGAARPPTTRWDPGRCARPGAGSGWPPSSGSRWSR